MDTLIRNIGQVKQAMNFAGLEYAAIHPSDIDAVIEINDKYIILMELKRKGNSIPVGQRLLLERIADKFEYGWVLFIEHDTNNTNESIDLMNAVVTQVYFRNKWYNTNNEYTKEYITQLANRFGIDKLQNI